LVRQSVIILALLNEFVYDYKGNNIYGIQEKTALTRSDNKLPNYCLRYYHDFFNHCFDKENNKQTNKTHPKSLKKLFEFCLPLQTFLSSILKLPNYFFCQID
jgi:hypothetical protein